MDFQPMSPEDMQRAMQFLVSQQAQFAADIARNETRWAERFDRSTERFDQFVERFDQLTKRFDQFVERFDQLTGRFDQLSAKTDQIAVGLIGLTGIVGQLAASQQRTEEHVDDLGEYIRSVESHLNVVVEMFERHLREDLGPLPS